MYFMYMYVGQPSIGGDGLVITGRARTALQNLAIPSLSSAKVFICDGPEKQVMFMMCEKHKKHDNKTICYCITGNML